MLGLQVRGSAQVISTAAFAAAAAAAVLVFVDSSVSRSR